MKTTTAFIRRGGMTPSLLAVCFLTGVLLWLGIWKLVEIVAWVAWGMSSCQ